MSLRKISLLLLAILMIILPVANVMAQDEALPDLGGITINVAVENAYVPFNYIDDATGEAIGWDYDVINEICARINCVPEYIETSWEGLILAVAGGEFDMAGDGITITPERAELVDFSMGYANIIQRLLVSVNEDRFSSVEEFVAGDYTIGAQLGTTNFLTAENLVGANRLISFNDFGSAVQAAIAGDVDAVIIDDVAGQGYVGENEESVRLIPDIIQADEQLGFIFPPDSELTAAINAGLLSLIEDGTLDEINAAYGLGPYQDLSATALPDLGGITINVAVENAYVPFNYIDDATGEAIGWDYDVINEICARINCVPEYIETSWEGLILAVAGGEFDMAGDGITITPERAELVDFSMGYANIIQRLLVSVNEDRFSSVEEFVAGDYTIGAQLGTTNFLTAENLVGANRLISFNDFGSAVQAAIAGDVDAVIIDDVAGQGYVGENEESVRLIPDIIQADEQLGFIFPPGSELTAAFDAALLSLIADGTLDEINAAHGLGPYQSLD
jgi:ABC-type amino acid transport substrate-binding protein